MRTFRAVSEIGGSIFCESLHFQRTTMRQGKSATMSAESKSKEDSLTQSNDSGGAVPSGFILKLFQMVNGAPDEVITVSHSFSTFHRRVIGVLDIFRKKSLILQLSDLIIEGYHCVR